MRVLVAHNLYRSSAPSGENQLVRAEIGLLRDGGVDVVEMLEDSDTIPGGVAGVLRAAPGPIYSPSGVRRFERLLVEHAARRRPSPPGAAADLAVGGPGSRQARRASGPDRAQLPPRLRERPSSAGRPRLHRLRRHPARAAGRAARLLPRLPAPDAAGLDRDGGASAYLARGRGPLPRPHAVHARHADLLRPARRPDHRAARPGCPIRAPLASRAAMSCTSAGSTRPRGSTASSTPGRWLAEAASIPQQRLVVAGDGPLRDLVVAAADLDPTITWLGQVASERVAQAMAEAAYVVVPSRVLRGLPACRGRGLRPRACRADRLGRKCRHHRGRRARAGWWTRAPRALAAALTSIDAERRRGPAGPEPGRRTSRTTRLRRGWHLFARSTSGCCVAWLDGLICGAWPIGGKGQDESRGPPERDGTERRLQDDSEAGYRDEGEDQQGSEGQQLVLGDPSPET